MKPKRRRRLFLDLKQTEIEGAASHDGSLFLGRFSLETLRLELESAGILGALAQRGYPEVEVRTETEAGEHRLLVFPRGDVVSLVDLRLGEASALVEEPLAREKGLDVLSFLAVHWLSLQHPLAHFTAERSRLPGQTYPSLRLGRQLMARVVAWAEAWGKDGLVNFPEYFHNALFYSEIFHFLSPIRQGRFEALARDLAPLGVARASWALEEEGVVEEPDGRPVAWESGEMAAPLTLRLKAYLASPEYRRAAATAREACHFKATEKALA